MNQNFIQPLILMAGTMPLIDSKYFELGFSVLLMSVLLWFGRNAIKKDTEREKWLKEQLKERDEEIKEKDQRYHDLHIELLNLYKQK